MKTNVCKVCGIDWITQMFGEICPRCQDGQYHALNPLANAPPLPSAEIEAIKVAMMQTGWVWKE